MMYPRKIATGRQMANTTMVRSNAEGFMMSQIAFATDDILSRPPGLPGSVD
jgi:hypothetical protein